MKSWKDDPRSETNPLFNGNRLKLGVFGMNNGSQIMTRAPEHYSADWGRADVVMGLIHDFGLEAMIPLMGWLPLPELEPFTWAAALGARYPSPAVASTMHVQLMHPTFVAKAAATADIITNGRFALNLVAGGHPGTFGPFGHPPEDSATRYAHAHEFMELLKRIWIAEEPIAFEGRFFNVKDVLSLPKPVQQYPAIMNAGTSGLGRDFACKHADMVFTILMEDHDEAKAQIADYRQYARDTYNRDIQIWTHAHIVIRDTDKEAEDFLTYYAVEHANREAMDEWFKNLDSNRDQSITPEQFAKIQRNWAAGNGSRLVGTADHVADEMKRLSDIGLDGILFNSIEPEKLMGRVGHDLLPRLEAYGLRNARV